MEWHCETCGCRSSVHQDNCPNGCESKESEVEIVKRFHTSVQEFCEVFQDDYDFCELCLKKEFTAMKKAFWEVKKLIAEG